MGRGKTIFDIDLVALARWHRRCVVLVLGVLTCWVVLIVMTIGGLGSAGSAGGFTDLQQLVVSLVWLGLMLTTAVFVVFVLVAMRTSVVSIVLHVLLVFFIAPLVLLSVVSSAGRVLRLAGAEMGFVGVSRTEVDKLRPGHCRGCGYDRTGIELLEPCPECRRVPMVI